MISTTWQELGVTEALLGKLSELGINEPTPIQAQAVPVLLSGKNLLAQSQTGTGKTLAYLLPLLQRINASQTSVQAVVLSPTQELAMQIVRVAEAYGEPLGIRALGLIGGAALKRQVERLKKHPQLIVGTPGRIHELLNMRKLKLNQVLSVVVDEADQVFQLGSVKEVETILWATAKERQLAFFSATRPPQMAGVESRWLKNAEHIHIAPEHTVSETIEHYYLVSERKDKSETVRKLVRLLDPKSALLFLNDTNNISNWEAKLSYEGFAVETLYGDADKQRRAATLARFRDGRCQLLLATDVAARGLDIDNLPLVINIDPPVDADHYVHRAGRTGRMGKSGTVVSIVTVQERFIMDKFRKALHIELPEKAMSRGKLVSPETVPFGNKGTNGIKGAHPAGKERLQETGRRYAEPRQERNERPEETGRRHEEALPVKKSRFQENGQRSVRVSDIRNSGERSFAGGQAAVSGLSGAQRQAKPEPKPGSRSNAKTKAERHKDRKDKGAPKWLKAKREGSSKE